MIEKIEHLLLISATSLIFLSVLLSTAAVEAGFVFPDSLNIGSSKSMLEGRKYTTWKQPTTDDMISGAFQDRVEKYLSDHIPMRDSVLLADAFGQRVAISWASALFGYEAYPTFYGSKYIVSPGENVVMERSLEIPASQKELDKWIDFLNRLANTNPNINYSINFIMEPRYVSANPSYRLMGEDGLMSLSWVQESIVNRLDESLHARIAPIDSMGYFKDYWFTNDHHWNLKGALETYNAIADTLKLEKKTWDKKKEVLFVNEWQGTAARSGRDYDYPCNLVDQSDDFSHLRVYKIGKAKKGNEISFGERESFIEGLQSEVSRVDNDGHVTEAYSDYYGGGNYNICNDGPNNGKTCLLIGDSFSRCLFRYIANNYYRTIYILPGNYKMKKTCEEYIEDYGVDDVVVIMHALKYEVIQEESPHFIE